MLYGRAGAAAGAGVGVGAGAGAALIQLLLCLPGVLGKDDTPDHDNVEGDRLAGPANLPPGDYAQSSQTLSMTSGTKLYRITVTKLGGIEGRGNPLWGMADLLQRICGQSLNCITFCS